jgi:hypothetical protein
MLLVVKVKAATGDLIARPTISVMINDSGKSVHFIEKTAPYRRHQTTALKSEASNIPRVLTMWIGDSEPLVFGASSSFVFCCGGNFCGNGCGQLQNRASG